MTRALFLLLAALLLVLQAQAAPAWPGSATPPPVEIVQHLGQPLPLALPLTDARGRAVRLGDYFGDGRPVLLLLGYYRCPQLCNLTAHALLDALAASGLAASAYRIVGISIDPGDTPATAAHREQRDLAYAALQQRGAGAAPPELHLLVGEAAATAALARDAGFGYQRQDDAGHTPRFAHAAGVMVATPDGRLSRYLLGLQFEPAVLRAALDEAAAGHVGGLAERLRLLCAHFDPRTGRHSGAVMALARGVGLAAIAGVAGLLWLQRRRYRKEAR